MKRSVCVPCANTCSAFGLSRWLASLVNFSVIQNTISPLTSLSLCESVSNTLFIWFCHVIFVSNFNEKTENFSRKRSVRLEATVIFGNHEANKETHPEFWNGTKVLSGFSKSGNKTCIAHKHTGLEGGGRGCWISSHIEYAADVAIRIGMTMPAMECGR